MVYICIATAIIIHLVVNLCGWKEGIHNDLTCQEEARLHNFINYGEKK